MNEHVSFKLKVRGVSYDQLKPILVTSDALLGALEILDISVEAYADAQAQAIADLYYDADNVECRWGWVSGGSGHYFYPRCPRCKRTRNFCTCITSKDFLDRVRDYEMSYGPGQLNKSAYLTSVIFSYHGHHYTLYPSKSLDHHFYAVIIKDGELAPLDLTPDLDSVWDTHKAAEIMIDDLTEEQNETT